MKFDENRILAARLKPGKCAFNKPIKSDKINVYVTSSSLVNYRFYPREQLKFVTKCWVMPRPNSRGREHVVFPLFHKFIQ